jgi:N-acetyl sugar amidotransferase
MNTLKICSRCVLDTTVPNIRFDEQGVCQYCHSHDLLTAQYPLDESMELRLQKLIEKVREDGKGKDFDCIVGLSGGTDSTYTLMMTKKLGLRPLAVHFDNGWNTNEAVTNIKNTCTKLSVELFTYVVDWEEIKRLQRSFLYASVPCVEAPSDVGIHGTLMRAASTENLKYILGGQSFYTEGTVPRHWSYLDGNYIKSVHQKFGDGNIKSFPNLYLRDIAYYTFVKGIRQIPFLNYFRYSKKEAKEVLAKEFGWKDYGGHHYENIYSKFCFGWLLPNKFNIDKRKVSLSGPVRSGHMKREAALKDLETLPEIPRELIEYSYKKLDFTQEEFNEILERPVKSYQDYHTSEDYLKHFRWPIKKLTEQGFLTPVLYEKYFG